MTEEEKIFINLFETTYKYNQKYGMPPFAHMQEAQIIQSFIAKHGALSNEVRKEIRRITR